MVATSAKARGEVDVGRGQGTGARLHRRGLSCARLRGVAGCRHRVEPAGRVSEQDAGGADVEELDAALHPRPTFDHSGSHPQPVTADPSPRHEASESTVPAGAPERDEGYSRVTTAVGTNVGGTNSRPWSVPTLVRLGQRTVTRSGDGGRRVCRRGRGRLGGDRWNPGPTGAEPHRRSRCGTADHGGVHPGAAARLAYGIVRWWGGIGTET
jgi:hypothetical protein